MEAGREVYLKDEFEEVRVYIEVPQRLYEGAVVYFVEGFAPV